VVEDAYSVRRSVNPICQDLELPGILESRTQNIHAQQNAPMDGMRLTDVQFLPQPVQVQNSGEEATVEIPGSFQMLYYDMDGNLRTGTQKWQENMTLPKDKGSVVEATAWPVGKVQGNLLSGSAQLSGDMKLITQTRSSAAIPMVKALEVGELQEPDTHRPSLILRRKGNESLWELAKRNGSTVAAIETANQLEAEPDSKQMLLIPVI